MYLNDNHTYISDEVVYNKIPISIQYIIVSAYVIMSWGTYNFVSNTAKIMLMYLYLYS